MPRAGIKSQVKPLPEKYINPKVHQNLYKQYAQPGGNKQPKGPYFKIPHFMNILLIFHISILSYISFIRQPVSCTLYIYTK